MGHVGFFSRLPSRKIGHFLTVTYAQLISFFVVTMYVLIFDIISLGLVYTHVSLLALNFVAGILSFVGFFYLYRGFSTGVMSIVAPTASSFPIVTILLSVVIMGIAVSGARIFVIGMVLIGITLGGIRLGDPNRAVKNNKSDPASSEHKKTTSRPPAAHQRIRITKGLDSAIVSCLGFGALYFILGFVTPTFGYIVPVLIMRGGAVLISLPLTILLRQKLISIDWRIVFFLIVVGVLDSLGYVSFNLGILSFAGILPLVTTLSALFGMVAVVLARIFYQEKLSSAQKLGILIIVVGVALALYL